MGVHRQQAGWPRGRRRTKLSHPSNPSPQSRQEPQVVLFNVPRLHPHLWPARCLQGFRFDGETQAGSLVYVVTLSLPYKWRC